METIFLISFFLGFIIALFSFFFGDLFDVETLPFLSPILIATVVTMFGGTGLFLSSNSNWSSLLIISSSAIFALLVGCLVFFFVVIPLHKAQKSAAESSRTMIGKTAEVIAPILKGKKGEIIYVQGGSRLSAPATSIEDIEQGAMVEIVEEMSGTFFVKKIEL